MARQAWTAAYRLARTNARKARAEYGKYGCGLGYMIVKGQRVAVERMADGQVNIGHTVGLY